MKIYVVEMLRWGNRELHSYVIGAFSTREDADLAGDAEVTWRAQKYDYVINEVDLDYIDPEKIAYHNQCI